MGYLLKTRQVTKRVTTKEKGYRKGNNINVI